MIEVVCVYVVAEAPCISSVPHVLGEFSPKDDVGGQVPAAV